MLDWFEQQRPPESVERRIRLANVIALTHLAGMLAVTACLAALMRRVDALGSVIGAGGVCFLLGMVLWLHRAGRWRTGRVLLVATLNLTGVLISLANGPSAGVAVELFAAMLVPLHIFGRDERLLRTMGALLPAVLYLKLGPVPLAQPLIEPVFAQPEAGWLQLVILFETAVWLMGSLAYRDNLERKTEQPLRASEYLHRSVLQGTDHVIFRADAGGRLAVLNAAWAKLTGRNVNESVGHLLMDFVHPEDRLRVRDYVHDVTLAEGSAPVPLPIDVRVVRADDSVLWMELGGARTRGRDGKGVMLTGHLVEITRRIQAIATLGGRLDLLRTVFDAVAHPVYARDQGHRIVECNQAYCDIVSRPRKQVIGAADLAIMPKDLAFALRQRDEQVLREGCATIGEEVVHIGAGSVAHFLSHAVPTQSPEGHLFVVGLLYDLCEQEKLVARYGGLVDARSRAVDLYQSTSPDL